MLPLGLNPKPLRRGTTHLYERIAEAVGLALGEDALASGGFTVHTTILAEAQNAAEKALLEQPGPRGGRVRDTSVRSTRTIGKAAPSPQNTCKARA